MIIMVAALFISVKLQLVIYYKKKKKETILQKYKT